jgi:hypothetical protein
MLRRARHEDVPVVPGIGPPVLALTSIGLVEPHGNTPLPHRARKHVAAARDVLCAETIAAKLQELVAIQRFLHAREAGR